MHVTFFKKITSFFIYTLVFFLPLVVFPGVQDWFEPQKQFLLVICVGIGSIAWLLHAWSEKQLMIPSEKIFFAPALFLLSVLVSTFLSKGNYQSWVGGLSQEYVSFLSTVFFVSLFYLLFASFQDIQQQKKLLFFFLSSLCVALILGALSFFKIVAFPLAMSGFFNTIGSLQSFAFTLLVGVMIGCVLFFSTDSKGASTSSQKVMRAIAQGFFVLFALATLFFLVILEAKTLWIFALLGSVLVCFFGIWKRSSLSSHSRMHFLLPSLYIFAGVFFFFLPNPFSVQMPLVAVPNYASSFTQVQSTLSSGVGRMFFGAGPGTYMYEYAHLKPASLNQTVFWNIPFDRSQSMFLTRVSDLGVVGSGIWLSFVIWLFFRTNSFLRKVKKEHHFSVIMVYVPWLMIVLAQGLFVSNILTEILFWMFSGLILAQIGFQKSVSLEQGTPQRFWFGVLSTVLVLGTIISLVFLWLRFDAEQTYAHASKMKQQNLPRAQIISEIQKASKKNPFQDMYMRSLGIVLMEEASSQIEEILKKETAEQKTVLSQTVSASLSAATRAVAQEPNRAVNWSLLGSVYRNLMPFMAGAEDKAGKAFENAIRLEPTNPVHVVDYARVYLAVADRARAAQDSKEEKAIAFAKEQEQKLLRTAESTLLHAIQLKPNYLVAHYYLAATYDREGKTQEAIQRLKALSNAKPQDIGLGFQLAQLHMRAKQLPAARVELERLIKIDPKYANALWFLASIYEEEGDLPKAIELIKKVEVLNPSNQMVKDRLAALDAGLHPTEPYGPIEPTE